MKTIKVKNQKIIELANDCRKKLQAATKIIETAGELKRETTELLFNTIYEEYPETKNKMLKYNHEKHEIDILYDNDN